MVDEVGAPLQLEAGAAAADLHALVEEVADQAAVGDGQVPLRGEVDCRRRGLEAAGADGEDLAEDGEEGVAHLGGAARGLDSSTRALR